MLEFHATLEPHLVTSFLDVLKPIRIVLLTSEVLSAVLGPSSSDEQRRQFLVHLGRSLCFAKDLSKK